MSLTQGNRRRPTLSIWLRWTAQGLLALVTLGLLAVAVAPYFAGSQPILALLEHFAAQQGASALFLLLAMLLLRMWRWALLAAGLTVWYGIALYPFLPIPGLGAGAASAGNPPLTVLSLNLWYRSENQDETVSYLLASGADVIGTVETTREWRENLKPLESVYPYHVDCVGKVFRCGVALFSKLPIRDAFADRVEGRLPTIVGATIDWQGSPVTIAELQLINPLIGLEEDFQAEQAAVAEGYFAKLSGDLVVMGDFNSAPWSRLQNQFRAASGLDNRGRLAFTWPSYAPAIFRLPIDQIFVRGGVVARNVRPGPAVGSDHLPILGEIYRTVP
jgi:endonuclease/exonuclease/phosphatase (EEP) superfamily protein YafD